MLKSVCCSWEVYLKKIEFVSDSTNIIKQLACDTQLSIDDGTEVIMGLDKQTNTTTDIVYEIIDAIEKLAIRSFHSENSKCDQ